MAFVFLIVFWLLNISTTKFIKDQKSLDTGGLCQKMQKSLYLGCKLVKTLHFAKSVTLWLLNGATACSRFVKQIVCEIAEKNGKNLFAFLQLFLHQLVGHLLPSPKRYQFKTQSWKRSSILRNDEFNMLMFNLLNPRIERVVLISETMISTCSAHLVKFEALMEAAQIINIKVDILRNS